jgi:hypothetical protein
VPTASATNHSSLCRDFLRLRQQPPIARHPRGRFVSERSRLRCCPPFRRVCLCPKNRFSWETETDSAETGSKVMRRPRQGTIEPPDYDCGDEHASGFAR